MLEERENDCIGGKENKVKGNFVKDKNIKLVILYNLDYGAH